MVLNSALLLLVEEHQIRWLTETGENGLTARLQVKKAPEAKTAQNHF
jgi:hypothetical protein